MAILDMTEDLVGEDIHCISDRASRRTFLALKTGLYGFTTGLNHFRKERILLRVKLRAGFHFLPLDPG
jgi:hypothetical protein